jgi:hypothetical protein
MASHAISSLRQILPPLDDAQLAERARDAGGIACFIVRQRYFLAIRKRHRSRTADDPNGCSQPHHSNRDNTSKNAAHNPAHDFFPAIKVRSIGHRRKATPAAASMALRSAGGPAVAPVSPMPPGASPNDGEVFKIVFNLCV